MSDKKSRALNIDEPSSINHSTQLENQPAATQTLTFVTSQLSNLPHPTAIPAILPGSSSHFFRFRSYVVTPDSENSNDLLLLLARIQEQRDEEACRDLWNAVYIQLAVLARQRLAKQNRRIADEDDVALSAVKSFIRAAEAGRLNTVQSADELWRVLITIMIRKSNLLRDYLNADKRGNGQIRGDSALAVAVYDEKKGFDQLADPDHPEHLVESLMGECRERIEALPDATLQQIALKRMEGHEVVDIATQLGIATATVKRKLARIRILWAEDDPRG
jgi:DNA-directed RNA polymerase specialized sigma24 family protein